MSRPHGHPYGPFTIPVPRPPAPAPAQRVPQQAAAPPPPRVARAPPNGAYALNLAYGHPHPANSLNAPVQLPPSTQMPMPATGFNPTPGPAVARAPGPAAAQASRPAGGPPPTSAPAAQRHVHWAPEHFTPAHQQTYLPETIFKSPKSSNPPSMAASPASSPRVPVRSVPRVIFGDNQPPGYRDPHPNFKLNSDHRIEYRGRIVLNAERLYHSHKFEERQENQGVIALVMASANPKAESERYTAYWDKDWNKKKEAHMLDVVRHKMCQYRRIQVATGNAELIDADDPTNILGRALMYHRDSVAAKRR